MMNDMRYSLIRYIPDMMRMEPINAGVILQSQHEIDFLLYPHLGRRKDIDTEVYRRWKEFFEEEISGQSFPLFQPPKNSPEFLINLARSCDKTVLVTPPLAIQVDSSVAFTSTLHELYDRLVKPPEIVHDDKDKPTAKYHEIESTQKFHQRGLKRNTYISGHKRRWNAFRHSENDANIVIDRIAIGNKAGEAIADLQKLSLGLDEFLPEFKSSSNAEYFLIADELKKPFSGQTPEDFDAMRDEMEFVIRTVRENRGKVVQSSAEVSNLGEYLDRHLPPMTAVAS